MIHFSWPNRLIGLGAYRGVGSGVGGFGAQVFPYGPEAGSFTESEIGDIPNRNVNPYGYPGTYGPWWTCHSETWNVRSLYSGPVAPFRVFSQIKTQGPDVYNPSWRSWRLSNPFTGSFTLHPDGRRFFVEAEFPRGAAVRIVNNQATQHIPQGAWTWTLTSLAPSGQPLVQKGLAIKDKRLSIVNARVCMGSAETVWVAMIGTGEGFTKEWQAPGGILEPKFKAPSLIVQQYDLNLNLLTEDIYSYFSVVWNLTNTGWAPILVGMLPDPQGGGVYVCTTPLVPIEEWLEAKTKVHESGDTPQNRDPDLYGEHLEGKTAVWHRYWPDGAIDRHDPVDGRMTSGMPMFPRPGGFGANISNTPYGVPFGGLSDSNYEQEMFAQINSTGQILWAGPMHWPHRSLNEEWDVGLWRYRFGGEVKETTIGNFSVDSQRMGDGPNGPITTKVRSLRAPTSIGRIWTDDEGYFYVADGWNREERNNPFRGFASQLTKLHPDGEQIYYAVDIFNPTDHYPLPDELGADYRPPTPGPGQLDGRRMDVDAIYKVLHVNREGYALITVTRKYEDPVKEQEHQDRGWKNTTNLPTPLPSTDSHAFGELDPEGRLIRVFQYGPAYLRSRPKHRKGRLVNSNTHRPHQPGDRGVTFHAAAELSPAAYSNIPNFIGRVQEYPGHPAIFPITRNQFKRNFDRDFYLRRSVVTYEVPPPEDEQPPAPPP